MFNNNYKFVISLASTTCSFLCILAFQKYYYYNHLLTKNNIDYEQQEQQLKVEANLHKNMPSLGFDNLIADWVFLQYIQYFGDTEAREKTGYSVITDYFETIVNKDPIFIKAHLSLSTANSLFAGSPQKTVSFLEKSLESITPEMSPHPFLLWAYKATDEVLFLGDLEAAKQSYLTAAAWAKVNNEEKNDVIVNRYHQTVAFLNTNPDSTATQISGWTTILSNNNDQKIKDYALKKIEELGGVVTVNPDGKISIKPPEKV